ncbi:MAG: FCD domain-containing protein [Clostridiales bacterium]|nr:FCD domain-containing protein [Clostridiales bacterium]
MGFSGVNVTEQVMKYIKGKLATGTWKVGSKLPSENELCVEFGCSRTSIRAAIQKYNVLGVLETQRGKGTFVRSVEPVLSALGTDSPTLGEMGDKSAISIDIETFRKWRQVRRYIEPQIIYDVAGKASSELIEQLKNINREQFEAVGNQELFIQKEVEFHMTLVRFLDNAFLIDIMRGLFSIHELLVLANDEFGYTSGVCDHMQMTDAIEHHDAERASRLMAVHQEDFLESQVASGKTS